MRCHILRCKYQLTVRMLSPRYPSSLLALAVSARMASTAIGRTYIIVRVRIRGHSVDCLVKEERNIPRFYRERACSLSLYLYQLRGTSSIQVRDPKNSLRMAGNKVRTPPHAQSALEMIEPCDNLCFPDNQNDHLLGRWIFFVLKLLRVDKILCTSFLARLEYADRTRGRRLLDPTHIYMSRTQV